MTGIRSVSKAIAAGVLGSLLWVGSASAQVITVEIQEGAGPTFTAVGAALLVTGTTTANYRVAVTANGDAVGPTAGSLGTDVLDITAVGSNPGTLFVRVTQQGNVAPGGFPFIVFNSGLTANVVPPNQQTGTLATLFDPADGLFTGTTLFQQTFTNVSDGASDTDVVANPGSPFSVSNLFQITANAGTTGRFTIELTARAVPGPVAGAALPALLGLAGVWFVRRRRKNSAA